MVGGVVKFIGKTLRALVSFILALLLITAFLAISSGDTSEGRRWCAETIEAYQAGTLVFDVDRQDVKIKRMDPSKREYQTPTLWVDPDGRYTCNVPSSGFLFPAADVYDSETGEWTRVD